MLSLAVGAAQQGRVRQVRRAWSPHRRARRAKAWPASSGDKLSKMDSKKVDADGNVLPRSLLWSVSHCCRLVRVRITSVT